MTDKPVPFHFEVSNVREPDRIIERDGKTYAQWGSNQSQGKSNVDFPPTQGDQQ